ncbi:hypothetical protein BCR33DRAFT_505858 [Rhizoclosmatium globosum]|uniref:C2H2-type domain-containing protein n=1 Tax=Rhizoclosmatium globosum TaxID=329046 RepID=A0A1Y2BKE7_9FUNG|nr:hypothetical protein BCR33DRAFT_505858 [Rhizoclosmatium globosum]|eukprot:ORY35248.1 hypothetical protein BCR33DRAFT_505858 [Rhizoclosmatium globosum]
MLEDAQTNFYHTQLQNWAPPSNQTTDDSDDEDSPTPVQTTKLASPDPLLGTQEIAHVLQTGTRHTQPILLDPIIPLCQCFGISLEALHQATSDPIPPFLRKCIASLHESLTLRKLKTPVDAWITGSAGLAQVPAIQFLRMEANGTCGGSGVHYSRVKREEPSVISALVKEFLGELPVGLVGTEVEETLRIVYDAYETVDMEEDDTIRLKTVSSLLLTLPTSHYETLKLLSHLLHITTKDLPDTSPKLFHLIRTLSPLILRAKIETTESLQDTLRDKLCYDLLRNYTDIFPALDDDPTNDHYNDRVFAPPTTPPPTDTFDDDDDIPNRGRHRISRNSTLFSGLVEGSKDVAEGAWRGLVKTVSGLNMNRAAATSAPQENVLFDSGVGRRFTVGSPLSRGRESESGEEWALPGDMARRHTSSVDAAARRLGLDNFSDVEESEYEEDNGVRAVVCNWKGCGREFEGNKALMLHIAGVHMGHDGTSSGVVVVSNPASM